MELCQSADVSLVSSMLELQNCKIINVHCLSHEGSDHFVHYVNFP